MTPCSDKGAQTSTKNFANFEAQNLPSTCRNRKFKRPHFGSASIGAGEQRARNRSGVTNDRFVIPCSDKGAQTPSRNFANFEAQNLTSACGNRKFKRPHFGSTSMDAGEQGVTNDRFVTPCSDKGPQTPSKTFANFEAQNITSACANRKFKMSYFGSAPIGA